MVKWWLAVLTVAILAFSDAANEGSGVGPSSGGSASGSTSEKEQQADFHCEPLTQSMLINGQEKSTVSNSASVSDGTQADCEKDLCKCQKELFECRTIITDVLDENKRLTPVPAEKFDVSLANAKRSPKWNEFACLVLPAEKAKLLITVYDPATWSPINQPVNPVPPIASYASDGMRSGIYNEVVNGNGRFPEKYLERSQYDMNKLNDRFGGLNARKIVYIIYSNLGWVNGCPSSFTEYMSNHIYYGEGEETFRFQGHIKAYLGQKKKQKFNTLYGRFDEVIKKGGLIYEFRFPYRLHTTGALILEDALIKCRGLSEKYGNSIRGHNEFFWDPRQREANGCFLLVLSYNAVMNACKPVVSSSPKANGTPVSSPDKKKLKTRSLPITDPSFIPDVVKNAPISTADTAAQHSTNSSLEYNCSSSSGSSMWLIAVGFLFVGSYTIIVVLITRVLLKGKSKRELSLSSNYSQRPVSPRNHLLKKIEVK